VLAPQRETLADVDALARALLAAGENTPRLRVVLGEAAPDDNRLVATLRRAVPAKLLELLGAMPPWSESPRVLGAVALNPRAPRALLLKILPGLYWRDLATVAATMRLPASARVRAEGLLIEKLQELRLGDRITLAHLATTPLLRLLLADADVKVVRMALLNPRLREADLVVAVEQSYASLALLREVAESTRWWDVYAVRVALVLQPRTPLGIALAQLTSLVPRDLGRIAKAPGLLPLVQMTALRVARRSLDS
jgi:hypothetical protein